MLLGAILVPTVVHAQTGVVSVNGGSNVVGSVSLSTVSVPIQISGSAVFSGFDVQVHASTAYLQGASVSLAGSILPSPSILAECINGVLIAGSSCSSQAGLGVVQLSAANVVGTQSTTGTGLLFTITYNVVGDTTGTPISFNTGCTSTSIASGDCVTIAASSTALPETDQGATFINLIDFSMTPQYPAYSTTASTPIGVMVNYASEGGYADFLTESFAVTPAGPSCTFASGTVDLLDFTTGSDTLTCSGAAGTYNVAITATGQSTPQTHTINVPLVIGPTDFSISLSQSSVTIPRGNSDSTTTVNLQGFSGFSGTVTLTSSAASGITGSAPMATLTPNGSGDSSASSTLTISVASSVATGSYPLTVSGTSGSFGPHTATITVVVPNQGFTFAATPSAISIIRGGTLAANLNLASVANFAGTVTLTAAITPVAGQQDSCCLTNNINPAFSSSSVSLTAGGTATVFFFASTVSGLAPTGANYTATGNYTATVTATSGSLSNTALITFNVQDVGMGPAFCTGTNFIQTTINSEYSFGGNITTTTPPGYQDIAGQLIGTPCTSLTITNQPKILFPYVGVGNQVLWVQDNALGGLVTDGFAGLPSVASLNPALPSHGINVPQLASVYPAGIPTNACMVPTFWPNGTQIPYSYLAQNGPLILPSTGLYPFLSIIGVVGPGTSNWGCRFDPSSYPHDIGVTTEFNNFDNSCALGQGCFGACAPSFSPATPCNYQNTNNPDFFGVTAMALNGTLEGDYTFQLCGQAGSIRHCQTYGLNVVGAPIVYMTAPKDVSFRHGHGTIKFFAFFFNPDKSVTEYVQATATGIGTFGDTIVVTTPVTELKAGQFSFNFAFVTALITSAMIGETFTFTVSMVVGTDPVNLDGTSTLHFGPSSFTVHIRKGGGD